MQVQRVIPVLRIFDEERAREFYLDFLGFDVVWEHRFEETAPLYMEIARGDLVLHLSEHHGDASPGSTVFVRLTGIEKFHAELIDKRYKYNRPRLEPTPWKSRSMTVHDPFGNRIRFDESDDATP